MLKLFKIKRPVRRFEQDVIIQGYSQSSFVDTMQLVDVQPVTDNRSTPNEGERRFLKLKVYCDFVFRAANKTPGVKGDWLWYVDRWYECTSSVLWETHTPLTHCVAEFTEIADTSKYPSPTCTEDE